MSRTQQGDEMTEQPAKRYVIDRIEDDDWIVLEDEDGRTISVPRGWLPAGCREGDVLDLVLEPGEDGQLLHSKWRIDDEARAERAERVRALRDRIPRGPTGDLAL
jgi:hypothetical protein